MRGWGAWSHTLWPRACRLHPDPDKAASLLTYTGPRAPVPFHRKDGLASPRSRPLPAGLWVEQPFCGISQPQLPAPRPTLTGSYRQH